MVKNQIPTDDTSKTTPNKPPKSQLNITKSKNKNRTKPPTSKSPINGIKDENNDEEQVKSASKKNKPSTIKKEKNQKKKVKENDDEEGINGIKNENHNEEQVKAASKKNNPSIIKKEEKNKKLKVKVEDEEVDNAKNENLLYKFPMNRISRIIKAESDARITQEAIFLINKASEKFIQLFSTEAFACSFLDKKKHISYQHLSSAVCKQKRLDFLSDYVPEKVKVEDALKEMPSVDT